jgi:hypothetical protein
MQFCLAVLLMLLPNYFKKEIKRIIKQSERIDRKLAVMFKIIKLREESHDTVDSDEVKQLLELLRRMVEEEMEEARRESVLSFQTIRESLLSFQTAERRRMEMARGASSSGRVQILYKTNLTLCIFNGRKPLILGMAN